MGVSIHLQQQLIGLDNESACWRLKVAGLTNREIAAELKIAPSSVHRALERAKKRAREAIVQDVTDDRVLAAARLEGIYRTAMNAWFDSISERRRTRSKRRTGGEAGDVTETQVDSETRLGDPRYLAEAYKAIDGMRKLKGLDAPTRLQVVDPDRPDLMLTDAEIAAELRATLRAAGVDPATLTDTPPADGERTH